MVKYLKKGFKIAKGIAKNPRRKLQRLAGKADRKLMKSKAGKAVRKAVRKADRYGMRQAKKAGLGSEYKAARKKVLKKSGLDKVASGKKGLVSTALRKAERMSGENLPGTKYSKKSKKKRPINKISNPVVNRRVPPARRIGIPERNLRR